MPLCFQFPQKRIQVLSVLTQHIWELYTPVKGHTLKLGQNGELAIFSLGTHIPLANGLVLTSAHPLPHECPGA